MKVKNLLTLCGVAAAILFTAGSLLAQTDNGGGNGGDQQGNGGGRRFRGNGGGPGGQGGGNFDPAQFQQRMVQGALDRLEITNDTERTAVEPLVTKVVEAQRDVRAGQMRGMFGRNRGNNNGGQPGGGRGNFGQPPDPAADALQKAIDDNAPSSQIKDLLAKYKASQKAKQSKLVSAQSDLRKVLTVKQEALATLNGLLD